MVKGKAAASMEGLYPARSTQANLNMLRDPRNTRLTQWDGKFDSYSDAYASPPFYPAPGQPQPEPYPYPGTNNNPPNTSSPPTPEIQGPTGPPPEHNEKGTHGGGASGRRAKIPSQDGEQTLVCRVIDTSKAKDLVARQNIFEDGTVSVNGVPIAPWISIIVLIVLGGLFLAVGVGIGMAVTKNSQRQGTPVGQATQPSDPSSTPYTEGLYTSQPDLDSFEQLRQETQRIMSELPSSQAPATQEKTS